MALIPLTNGSYVIVDNEAYQWLKQFEWSLGPSGYAVRYEEIAGKVKMLAMHRLVLLTPRGSNTDHINGDKLDNRKANLRVCTQSENQGNRRKTAGATSSKYKGVYWHKRDRVWRARIRVDYKGIELGGFKSEEDAAKAYNVAAAKHFGEFARLNRIHQHPTAAPPLP